MAPLSIRETRIGTPQKFVSEAIVGLARISMRSPRLHPSVQPFRHSSEPVTSTPYAGDDNMLPARDKGMDSRKMFCETVSPGTVDRDLRSDAPVAKCSGRGKQA